MLSAFPTSSSDDEPALAAAHRDDLRSAILFRLEKKRSLVDAMQMIAARVKVGKVSHLLRSVVHYRTDELEFDANEGVLWRA